MYPLIASIEGICIILWLMGFFGSIFTSPDELQENFSRRPIRTSIIVLGYIIGAMVVVFVVGALTVWGGASISKVLGIQSESATSTANVHMLVVGAGGNAGPCGGAGGGGGVVPIESFTVVSGEHYQIHVGTATNGGETYITSPNGAPLIAAYGGQGGQAAPCK